MVFYPTEKAHETARPRQNGSAGNPDPVWGALLAGDVEAQQAATTHTIFMNVVEYKGTTTTEKLAPSSINPATLSKG